MAEREISGTMVGAMLVAILVLGFAFFYGSAVAPNAAYPSNSSVNMTFINSASNIANQADNTIEILNSIQTPSSIPLYAEFVLVSAFISFVKLIIGIVGLAFYLQFDILRAFLSFLPFDAAAPAMAVAAIMFSIELIGIGLFILSAIRPPGIQQY
jgi:hypothetical protein